MENTTSPSASQKTENRHHPDIQNYQKNRLGQPGLQMYTVPIKADVKNSQWYNKRAQRKTTNTESNWLQTLLLLDHAEWLKCGTPFQKAQSRPEQLTN